MFDAEAASFVCDFIECLTCSNGAPFRLMVWQRDAVTEFYGQLIEAEGVGADPAGLYIRRYQYLYLVIAKKNGKSELAAALGAVSAAQRRIRALEEENRLLKGRMEDVRLVGRAKCILMTHMHMREPEAHRYIEKQAMDRRTTRRAIAEGILKTYEN